MICRDLETWMMTEETPQRPSVEVRRHLRSCAVCRKQYGRLVRLIHEVAQEPLPPVPASSRDKLLACLTPRSPAVVAAPVPTIPLPRQAAWKRWGSWAAAAVLFLSLGLGLSLLTRSRPLPPQANVEPEKPLEERILDHHLSLSESSEPSKRVTTLNDLAGDIRQESLEQAKRGAADDLSVLVWLHARILSEGVVPSARLLPVEARAVVSPIVAELQEAARKAESLARQSPEAVAKLLHELSRQSGVAILALTKGGEGPHTEKPAVAATMRSLLQVLVTTSLQTAHEDDPVKRAEQSTELADSVAQTMVKQSGKGDAEEMKRLAESLETIMERGVRDNLEKIDLDKIDADRRKMMEKVKEKAGEAVKLVQPNAQQLPQEAQMNLLRAIELAKQLQQMQKRPFPGKGPPFKKPKPKNR